MRPEYRHIRAVWGATPPLRHADPARWRHLRQKSEEIEMALFGNRGTVPPQEELDALKPYLPEAWWARADPLCPGCGAAGVDVPAAFEAPPKKDVNAWKAAEAWLAGREEAAETMRQWEQGGNRMSHYWACKWRAELEPERKRRIKTLQKAVELGVHTSEEERRLAVIRARKGKPAANENVWAVAICPEVFVME